MSFALSPYRASSSGTLHNFIENVKRGGVSARASLARAGDSGEALVEVGGNYAVAGAMGLALAAVHVHAPHGLQWKVPGNGIGGVTEVPMDLAAAGVLGALAVMKPKMRGADAAKAFGTTAAGVYAFRKGYDFMASKARTAGKMVGGSFGGEDHYAGETPIGADTESSLLEAVAAL